MRPPRVIGAAALGAAVGIAAWSASGRLDFVTDGEDVRRIAMLPSLVRLVLLASGGAVLVALLDRWVARGILTPVAWLLLPLAGLLILLLPYLPWLPDALPILTVPGGPFRYLLIAMVLGQVVWIAARRRSGDGTAGTGVRPRTRGLIAIFVAGFSIFSTIAIARTRTVLYPGGDEPHYLIMAQSLWRDGDLEIENNHSRGDYLEYFDTHLPPHYLARGVDNEIYSVHPVGLPVLIAPIYAGFGYRGVVLFLAAVAAFAAALMWRWAWEVSNSPGAATYAWAGVALSVPFVFNAFAVYPEIPAACCVMLALATAHRSPQSLLAWTGRGCAVAALPWLSTKYAPMAAALVLVLAGRIWTSDLPRARRMRAVLCLLGPFAVGGLAWLSFFWVFWGTFSPTAPYGTYTQTRPLHLLTGAPGLLFDQEYGILIYAPVLLLALVALGVMFAAGRGSRRLAFEIACVAGALVAAVGAFRIWWGGSAPPGRPVASGLLLMGPPLAWVYAQARAQPWFSAVARLLLLVTLTITVTVAVAQEGFLIANGRDGSSALLRWLSPAWRLWGLAPTYIAHPPSIAAGFTVVWLASAAFAVLLLRRLLPSTREALPTIRHDGIAGAAAVAVSLLAVVAASATVSTLFASHLPPDVRLEARARVPMLDEYDATRRPLALVYDPLTRIAADSVPSRFTLRAAPDLERPPQPVPVLFGARFALPAGTYQVGLEWPAARAAAGEAGELSLHVGSLERPFTQWAVRPSNEPWQDRFAIPIDTNFVGFRATPSVESAGPTLTLQPLSVVDAARRPRVPEVLQAHSYGSVWVFFHSGQAWFEPSGFWTGGGTSALVTVASPAHAAPVLRLRAGPVPNRVAIEVDDERQEVELQPHETVPVPLPRRELLTVRIRTTAGFVPAEVDAATSDRRNLGCWVEVEAASTDAAPLGEAHGRIP